MRLGFKGAMVLSLGPFAVGAVAYAAPTSYGEPPTQPSASATLAAPSSSQATPLGASSRPNGAPSPAQSAALKLDPKGKKGVSPYTVKLLKGHTAYAARDFRAAAAAYRDAIAENVADPTGYYLLGQAELAAGNAAEADASFQNGLKNAGANDEAHAKLLFVVADLRERQARWVDAKKAWELFTEFLVAHPELKASAASGPERSKVLDIHFDLETKYAAVKERIEQRLRETGGAPKR
jgi:tetratricopeptide (TPR) repeat protein